ncbi:MAG: LCCL domain-containing protein [Pyrinomonadaceae bacterium]
MKVCPTCSREYVDEALNYCLMDGAPLVEATSAPTVVMAPADATTIVQQALPTRPTGQEPKKPKRKALWIVGIVFGMLVLVAVSAYLLAMLMWRGQAVQANRERANSRAAANTGATPRPSRTATPEPTVEPDQSPASSPPPASEGDPEGPTPIQWTTAAATFDTTPGRTYQFECPADGTAGTGVWGSEVYSGASSICAAAVHGGIITLEDGGQVEIEMRPGRSVYGSTTRNGVTTYNYGEYPTSFIFKPKAKGS